MLLQRSKNATADLTAMNVRATTVKDWSGILFAEKI
jgi:hypothetical protein